MDENEALETLAEELETKYEKQETNLPLEPNEPRGTDTEAVEAIGNHLERAQESVSVIQRIKMIVPNATDVQCLELYALIEQVIRLFEEKYYPKETILCEKN